MRCNSLKPSLALFVVCASVLFGARVPGHYIVELSEEPVAEHIFLQGGREDLRGAAASTHRAKVQAEQQKVRSLLEQHGVVLGSTDTVANAVVVQIPDENAAQLASLPGVRRVHPVHTVHMLLDRAVLVNKVAEAWNQVGYERAGAGVKIAIVDSGIDVNHAGFQDSSLPVPASFPRFNDASDQVYTNNKVIVARSYVNLLPARDPDRSARDHVGHGTALAMVAAGVRNMGPLATIAGVAPKAWLGSYKVFGTPGYNDTSTDAAILKAIDDAVADGMDVISLSLGSDVASRLSDDMEVAAVERASRAGVIVVAAAGNNGPDKNTISSPATAPSAIAVGASRNDRTFAASAEVTGLPPFAALLSDGPNPASAISGNIVDVVALDGTGLACASLPAGALSNGIALILRGDCTFETKLGNAQRAGAIGALVYAAQSSPDPIAIAVGAATLPAEMIGYAEGIAIKQSLAEQKSAIATLRFTRSAVSIDSNRLAVFSAVGPNVDAGIKPDLVAAGADIYVAAQRLDQNGEMYDPSGYILVDGTSFSTPLVAGAAALLKSARPGLTVDQYRSLLINSASPVNAVPGVAAKVQQAGGGLLNCGASVLATTAAYPTALNFGAGGPDPRLNRTLTISNLGTAFETYTIAVNTDDNSAPSLATNTIQLDAGASSDVPVSWGGSGLTAGAHEGFIRVIAATSGAETRIPYWYGVASDVPANITILDTVKSARRGALSPDAILFRVTDAAGLPLANAQPKVSVSSGGATVQSLVSHDNEVPGMYGLNVRLGAAAGTNTFHIQASDASVEVSITGR